MLDQRISKLIEYIKTIKKVKDENAKIKRQKQIDEKFKSTVSQYEKYVKLYIHAKNSLGFSLSNDALSILKDIVKCLNEVVINNQAQEKGVNNAAILLNSLVDATKREWKEFYHETTSGIRNTLHLFQSIKPEEVGMCISKLNSAQMWEQASLKSLDDLKLGVQSAKKFIAHNSDERVTAFLMKIYSGTARLSDLTPEVMAWIDKEKLAERITISFK